MEKIERPVFIELEDLRARRRAQEFGCLDTWLSYSKIRDQKGKLILHSFFNEGPFIFFDCRSKGLVSSYLYYVANDQCILQKISDRPIAQEAFRMFCWGIPLDLIKRQWQGNEQSPILPRLLSEGTRYQLIQKQCKANKQEVSNKR